MSQFTKEVISSFVRQARKDHANAIRLGWSLRRNSPAVAHQYRNSAWSAMRAARRCSEVL